MSLLFSLDPSKCPSAFQTSFTLSEISIDEKDCLIIPQSIIEDGNLDNEKIYTVSEWDTVIKKRISATWDCKLDDFSQDLPIVPFVKSKLIRDEKMLKEFISQHISEYGFVKTCRFSPKDVSDCCFTDTNKAVEAIVNSERTKKYKGHHIVMKKIRHFTQEFRCFWYNDKLRVVVSKESISKDMRKRLTEFFEKYKYSIPFHNCCIELGLSKDYDIEIIEFNSLGPDLICDVSPLEWSQNWEIIMLSSSPKFISVD